LKGAALHGHNYRGIGFRYRDKQVIRPPCNMVNKGIPTSGIVVPQPQAHLFELGIVINSQGKLEGSDGPACPGMGLILGFAMGVACE
jgi:hypothetical protein